mmetsp:Transcript_9118/g.16402  ORF Transcript_9118/g.16402 Transcript_9118/m.16402 type:complete len:221 (+) Transcript_9118:39-701(+)
MEYLCFAMSCCGIDGKSGYVRSRFGSSFVGFHRVLKCDLVNQHKLESRIYSASIEMAAKSSKKKKKDSNSLVFDNRIARNRYEFLELYVCGVELVGTEIKSVRAGSLNIRDAYCRVSKDQQIYLHNAHIAPCEFASAFFNHAPLRDRKLLLHKRSIRKLQQAQAKSGLTIVPTRCFFTSRGWLKVQIALAKGKQLHDKRREIKDREQKRELQRVIKNATY